MNVNAAVAAAAAVGGVCTGVMAMLAFRWSEREQTRPTRSSRSPLHIDSALPPGVDTVLSVLRSSAVVLDEADAVVKASSAAYALGLVRGGRLAVEPMLRMARDTRRDGEIRQVDLDLPRRGTGRGDTLAVSARVAPLGSRLVLVLVEDMTEARRIEAIRRDFVANVSHELKTPVGALSLLAEAVLDAADDQEAVERFAGRMQNEATRLGSLVQELIDLSRVQNDDPLEDSEQVRVDELVQEAVERCRQTAGIKHITLAPQPASKSSAGSSGSGDLYVWGNRSQLAAALGNLVENAVNYSPARTRVGIAAQRTSAPGGDMIEIAVTDQGIGISERDRERIFERFYRVDPARSRATGGTGLGLAIVKHVAASHGGEVTVWSAEGQGSTFTLRLPEAGSAREHAEAARRSRHRLSGALREPADVESEEQQSGPAEPPGAPEPRDPPARPEAERRAHDPYEADRYEAEPHEAGQDQAGQDQAGRHEAAHGPGPPHADPGANAPDHTREDGGGSPARPRRPARPSLRSPRPAGPPRHSASAPEVLP